jgi:hypothetical protein
MKYDFRLRCGHCGKVTDHLDEHAQDSEPCARRALSIIESYGPALGRRIFGTDNLYQQALAWATATVEMHNGNGAFFNDPRN